MIAELLDLDSLAQLQIPYIASRLVSYPHRFKALPGWTYQGLPRSDPPR